MEAMDKIKFTDQYIVLRFLLFRCVAVNVVYVVGLAETLRHTL